MRLHIHDLRVSLLSAVLVATAMGAAATVAGLHRATTAAGLPYPQADRLVTAIAESKSWSPAMLDAASGTTVFDLLAGVQERGATLQFPDRAELVRLESVSSTYFDLLGVRAVLGRPFGPAEDRRGVPTPVAVISHRLWQRRLDADPGVLGRFLTVDQHRLQIIGVLPAQFGGLIGQTDVWVPLGSARWLTGDTEPERPSSRWFETIGRLRAGISIEAAEQQFLGELPPAFAAAGVPTQLLGSSPRLQLVPLSDARIPAVARGAAPVLLWSVSALCAFVAVTLASLWLLCAQRRAWEIAVRIALGAERRHLIGAAARDGALVAALAMPLALMLRPAILFALQTVRRASTGFGIVTADWMPPAALALDLTTAGVLAAGGIVTMAIPALVTMATTRVGGTVSLRARHAAGGLSRLRTPGMVLATVQVALACVVVAGGLLLSRAVSQLIDADRGYDWTGVTTARLGLPGDFDRRRAAAFYESLEARLISMGGFDGVSISSCVPGGGRCRRSSISQVDDIPLRGADAPQVGVHFVSPGHFDTIGARVTRGRATSALDTADAPASVVISDRLADRLWPGADPLGRRIEVFTANGSLAGLRTVVGTVHPIRFDVDADLGLDVFLPAGQVAWTSGVVFMRGPRTERERHEMLTREAAALDSRVVVHDAASLEARLARSLAAERLIAGALLTFAAVAVLLAVLGIYTMTSQAVAGAERELAVRKALGASMRDIQLLVGRRAVVVAVTGAIAGTTAALWGGGVLTALLHGMPPTDPIILLAPLVTSVAVAAAVAWPIHRANHVNPVLAMRE